MGWRQLSEYEKIVLQPKKTFKKKEIVIIDMRIFNQPLFRGQD